MDCYPVCVDLVTLDRRISVPANKCWLFKKDTVTDTIVESVLLVKKRYTSLISLFVLLVEVEVCRT